MGAIRLSHSFSKMKMTTSRKMPTPIDRYSTEIPVSTENIGRRNSPNPRCKADIVKTNKNANRLVLFLSIWYILECSKEGND